MISASRFQHWMVGDATATFWTDRASHPVATREGNVRVVRLGDRWRMDGRVAVPSLVARLKEGGIVVESACSVSEVL